MNNKEIFLQLIKKYNLPEIITNPIEKRIKEIKNSFDNRDMYIIFEDNTCLSIGIDMGYELGDEEIKILTNNVIDHGTYLNTLNSVAGDEFYKLMEEKRLEQMNKWKLWQSRFEK